MTLNRRLKKKIGIPTSAMSDIAFLLLIFFMLSSFAEVDKEIPINMPVSEISKPAKDQFFNVWIGLDQKLYYDNEEGTIDGLANYASYRLAQNPQIITLIRADKDVEYHLINDILDALKQGGIKNVLFVSQKKDNVQ